MAAPRRVVEVAISEEEASELERLARSRTEPASRVERARMLLAYQPVDEVCFPPPGYICSRRKHRQTARYGGER